MSARLAWQAVVIVESPCELSDPNPEEGCRKSFVPGLHLPRLRELLSLNRGVKTVRYNVDPNISRWPTQPQLQLEILPCAGQTAAG
eukprot:scaffold106444_cov30-Tisochrysis_lutea.AAC.3